MGWDETGNCVQLLQWWWSRSWSLQGSCSASTRLRTQLSSFYVWCETLVVRALTRVAFGWNLPPGTSAVVCS